LRAVSLVLEGGGEKFQFLCDRIVIRSFGSVYREAITVC
jgi:hypothetical protein